MFPTWGALMAAKNQRDFYSLRLQLPCPELLDSFRGDRHRAQ